MPIPWSGLTSVLTKDMMTVLKEIPTWWGWGTGCCWRWRSYCKITRGRSNLEDWKKLFIYLFFIYLFIYLSIYLFFLYFFIYSLFVLFIYLFIYLCIYSLFICFIYLLIYSLLPVYVLIAAPRPSLCRFFSVCWHAVANFEVTCALAC